MKLSKGKLIFALSIINVYLFAFTAVGNMGFVMAADVNKNDDGIVIEPTESETEWGLGNDHTQITVVTPSDIETISPIETMPEQTTAQSLDIPATPSESEDLISPPKETTGIKIIIPIPTTKAPETEKPQTTPVTPKPETPQPQTLPPETVPPATTVTTTPTTVTPTNPPVTPPPATQAPVTEAPSNDVFDEILYVVNSKNGQQVSGKAIDIVSAVVNGEMGASFNTEALKAQAVAAYTNIKYKNARGICPELAFKSLYDSRDSDRIKITNAVSAVLGEMIYYNDRIIDATFYASSAGSTLASADVWGGHLNYLVRVETPFDGEKLANGSYQDPNYGRTQTFTSKEIADYASAYGISLTGDPANWLTIKSRLVGKYVDKIDVGGKVVSGFNFRAKLMSYKIRSHAFDITYNTATDTFTFTTYGYGHGVGLSQNGANILASQGKTYKQILQFYYTGVTIK